MATDSELPMFSTETRYYRSVLGISFEFGEILRDRGLLVPDAVCDHGRALFLLSPEKLEEARKQVFLAKARELKTEAAAPLSAT